MCLSGNLNFAYKIDKGIVEAQKCGAVISQNSQNYNCSVHIMKHHYRMSLGLLLLDTHPIVIVFNHYLF